jgi:hypothetical protein
MAVLIRTVVPTPMVVPIPTVGSIPMEVPTPMAAFRELPTEVSSSSRLQFSLTLALVLALVRLPLSLLLQQSQFHSTAVQIPILQPALLDSLAVPTLRMAP